MWYWCEWQRKIEVLQAETVRTNPETSDVCRWMMQVRDTQRSGRHCLLWQCISERSGDRYCQSEQRWRGDQRGGCWCCCRISEVWISWGWLEWHSSARRFDEVTKGGFPCCIVALWTGNAGARRTIRIRIRLGMLFFQRHRWFWKRWLTMMKILTANQDADYLILYWLHNGFRMCLETVTWNGKCSRFMVATHWQVSVLHSNCIVQCNSAIVACW